MAITDRDDIQDREAFVVLSDAFYSVLASGFREYLRIRTQPLDSYSF